MMKSLFCNAVPSVDDKLTDAGIAVFPVRVTVTVRWPADSATLAVGALNWKVPAGTSAISRISSGPPIGAIRVLAPVERSTVYRPDEESVGTVSEANALLLLG